MRSIKTMPGSPENQACLTICRKTFTALRLLTGALFRGQIEILQLSLQNLGG